MPTQVKTLYLGLSYINGNSAATPPETTVFRTIPLVRSKDGISNPLWVKQVKSGQQAGTFFTGTGQYLRVTPGRAVATTTKGRLNPKPPPALIDLDLFVEGSYNLPVQLPSWVPVDESKAKAQALSRLYSALRQQRTSMQAGVSFGELRESILGVRHVTGKLASMFKKHVESQRRLMVPYLGQFEVGLDGSAVRSTRNIVRYERLMPTAKQFLAEQLRDGWLSLSLGMRPLVADVKNLAQTIARWKYDESHTRIRGYGKDKQMMSTFSVAGSQNGINYIQTTHKWKHVEVIYRAGLQTDVDSPAFGSAHRLYQLMGAYDLENWIPTVWNLLPWSFVVDYVTNMSDVVTAMVTDRSRVQWVIKTTITGVSEVSDMTAPYQQQYVGIVDGQPVYRTQAGSLGAYEFTTRQISRVPEAGMELPTLSFNLPSADGLAIPNLLALFSGRKTSQPFN